MKRYKINKNTGDLSGWKYRGSTDDYTEVVQEFETIGYKIGLKGLRITDTETNEIIYEKTI